MSGGGGEAKVFGTGVGTSCPERRLAIGWAERCICLAMNRSIPAQNFMWKAAAFVGLSLLPCLMNAFPRAFSYAFSEQADRWMESPFVSFPIMAAVLVGWSWAAVGVAGAWQSWLRSRGSAIWSGFELTLSFSPRVRAIGRCAMILHGPILVALFYLMWVSARISLGRWPYTGGRDDPKGIFGTAIVYGAICIWFWIGIVALGAPLVRAGVARDVREEKRAVRDFALTLALIVAAFAFILDDPHRLLTWFLD
jgi:hypothetical protein